MILSVIGHKHRFECENLCRVFFPYSPVRTTAEATPAEGEEHLVTRFENGFFYVSITGGGNCLSERIYSPHCDEYELVKTVYSLLSSFTAYTPPWGMLTGIHPVKLFSHICRKAGEKYARDVFENKYCVSAEKSALALRVAQSQRETVEEYWENDFSLYISIPFCPTRCVYCSFVSQSIEKAGKLVEPYLVRLKTEIEQTAHVANELGLRLVSVYIGGGTPTTLDENQIFELIESVKNSFDMTACREFTVEAGRPDTITEQKLYTLKDTGVTRISINPQSLSDRVLEAIGRSHRVSDVYEAFEMALKIGFKDINSDIIAGLPQDSEEGFERTLEGVIGLGATNITVHCLAIKRASKLLESPGNLTLHSDAGLIGKIIENADKRLTDSGFSPYYLYRQTHTAGNLENTGWAKSGSICRYNIYTMDETGTVIACGAGGVSKIRDPYSERLERIFNFKYPYEYIGRFDEMIERKRGVVKLYEQFRKRIY